MEDAAFEAEQILARVEQLLAQPATLDSYDWLLVATLLGEADDLLQRTDGGSSTERSPRLGSVLEELRDATCNFTNPQFLRVTRPARRRNPHLFRQA